MGTSIAFGMYVPESDLFYVRATPALRRILGRQVEWENLGMLGPDLGFQDKMIGEIANLSPDGVFFIIVPFDLKRLDDKPLWVVEKKEMHGHGFFGLPNLAYLGRSSRAFFLAQHYILSQPDFAVRAFEMKSDPDDPARIPGSAISEERFERLDGLIQRLSTGFRSRGIPLYVVTLPSRLQTALIGKNAKIPGVDPLAFSRRVDEMTRKAGAQCIDATPEFERTRDPERAFYPVDGHLDALGNQLVADAIVNYFATFDRADTK